MLRAGGPSKATQLLKYPGFEPTGSVKPGDSIDTGGYCFKVISAPGHTAGSVCFYDQQHDVIISGDLLCGPFWAWGYFVSLNAQIITLTLQTKKALQVQLETFEKLVKDGIIKESTLIMPGHGAPYYLSGKPNNAAFTKGFIRFFRSFKR
jgi:glyoxylase-like metal-dependent hydrolase (beta-lactamase superfamily II)